MSARCRVCGVYTVKRAGQLIIYCLDGCPMNWPDISSILNRAEMAYNGGSDALINFWSAEWQRLGKKVKPPTGSPNG